MILQNILQIISFYSVIETFTLFFSQKHLLRYTVYCYRAVQNSRVTEKKERKKDLLWKKCNILVYM